MEDLRNNRGGCGDGPMGCCPHLSLEGRSSQPGCDSTNRVPPVFVPGGRTVETRNSSGGLTRQSSIPGDSAFATFGGGDSATCQFTAEQDGETSDGTPYVAGQVVISTRFVFREVPSSFSPEPSLADNTMHGVSGGPLADAVRYFAVYCDSLTRRRRLPVSVNDPLRPRPWPLQPPQLGVRWSTATRWSTLGCWSPFPTWLAVRPSAWRCRSRRRYYLGGRCSAHGAERSSSRCTSCPARQASDVPGWSRCRTGAAIGLSACRG
jgi:hypothetical protein